MTELKGTPTISEQKLRWRIRYWYGRPDVQEALYQFVKEREVVVFDIEEKKVVVPRPYVLQYPEDVWALVSERGAASFHSTTERWLDFDLLKEQKYRKAIKDFDLVIDIDLKASTFDSTIRLNKKVVSNVLKLLELFDINPEDVIIKYSGNKGFHIIVPWSLIPEEYNGTKVTEIKDLYCQAVLLALNYFLTRLLNTNENVVDTLVAAWRHPIRALYSLHMKTGLPSIPVEYSKLYEFDPKKISVKELEVYPIELEKEKVQTRLNELAEIGFFLMEGIRYSTFTEVQGGKGKKKVKIQFDLNVLDDPEQQELLPPCIRNILKGVEDGRKRALFVLENFFAWYGWSFEQIRELIYKWNERNPEPLRESYIEGKLNHLFSRAIPSMGRPYFPYKCPHAEQVPSNFYTEIGVCQPDEVCKLIKNPLQYPKVKARMMGTKKKRK